MSLLPPVVLLLPTLLLALAPAARAYPSLFVNQFANTPTDCMKHTEKAYGSHGAPSPDA